MELKALPLGEEGKWRRRMGAEICFSWHSINTIDRKVSISPYSQVLLDPEKSMAPEPCVEGKKEND